jgi:hypothetical protein
VRVRDRELYEYDEVPAAAILRPLDPTEHNMERLNRLGRGAGIVYQTARVRGPLHRAAVEAALRALTRHPALRMRVARGPDGVLGFAETASIPQLTWIDAREPAREWPEHVEADMNAGAVPSHRGSAFRVFVFGAGDEHAITLTAPHHVWDGISSVALMLEFLEQIAELRTLAPVMLRAVESPFLSPCSADQRARLQELALEVTAWAAAEPVTRSNRRKHLSLALEKLEAELLAEGDATLPVELLDVQRLLAQVQRSHLDAQHIVPDEDPGVPPERARRVRSGLFVDELGPDVVTGLSGAARQRGVTLHGVFGGALLFAHAARHWALSGTPDVPQLFPLASPVNLRNQFHPPLADDDVRMAVDVALTVASVGPADTFWDVAAQFGACVTSEVRRRRALGSWFRTERRSMELPLSGVPIPLLSNLGRIAAKTRYGDLELLELHACMSTHSMFQIVMLIQTIGGAANLSYYHELPTVSRDSMRRLAYTVRTLLERVASGQSPLAMDALSA